MRYINLLTYLLTYNSIQKYATIFQSRTFPRSIILRTLRVDLAPPTFNSVFLVLRFQSTFCRNATD